tara:strand:- start:670 stop:870 length:201 start_codon:yes stop_codon:yes gene_type:complete
MNGIVENILVASSISFFLYLCGSFGLMTFDITEWHLVFRALLPIWGVFGLLFYWPIKQQAKLIGGK